jgi:hypothetical protein
MLPWPKKRNPIAYDRGAASRREIALNEPRFTYTAEQQAADGAEGPLQIEVVQIGTHAQSRAAILVLDQ